MPFTPPLPCPVRLGIVKSGGLPAQLHEFTRDKNIHKIRKLLKKGVNVDCTNHIGQTPLFCAALLGHICVAELLLQFGADPNHRCDDLSTPVHAAVFSCDPWLLSKLLDAGGDLRLHDDQGRMPRDWAEIGAQEHSARMLYFLKSCATHMNSLSKTHLPRAQQSPVSCKSLLQSPSLLEVLRPWGFDPIINRKLSTKSFLCDTVQCFGYGKLCVEKVGFPVGLLTSIPLISDSELSQAEDEALFSFTCNPFVQMTNYSWRGIRVTVKELHGVKQHVYQDLLITELESCRRLFHPHLLQLMAVSMPLDLQKSRLVYERVHMGSLYTLLYQRRADFPVLQVCELLSMVLQVCEAVLYLHCRSLVLRSLSSHSVIIVHSGVAKITGLSFITSSDGDQGCGASQLPLPVTLYNWAAPEVIRGKQCSAKADLYSICALIQELYTDEVPWGSMDSHRIKQAVDAGQALSADPVVPQPYYRLLLSGLSPIAQDRTCSLQDLRYTLRSDLREFSERERQDGAHPLLAKTPKNTWRTEVRNEGASEEPDQQMIYHEIQNHLQHLDIFQEKQCDRRCSSTSLQSSEFSANRLLLDFSESSSFTLEERHTSDSSPEQEILVDKQDKATQTAVSDHFRNLASEIILNQKVSHMLVQEAESHLHTAESVIIRMSPRCPEFDEVDVYDRWSLGKVEVLKAVGPPSIYNPCSYLEEEKEEVCEFYSAVEESFHPSEREGERSEGQKQVLRDRELFNRLISKGDVQEQRKQQRVELTWTSKVTTAVSRMAWELLGSATGASACVTESNEAQGQCCLPVDPQEEKNLKQTLKSCTGDLSKSGESDDLYTIHQTSLVHHLEWAGQTGAPPSSHNTRFLSNSTLHSPAVPKCNASTPKAEQILPFPSASESLDETRRANFTLDEVMQDLLEKTEGLKSSERPDMVTEDQIEIHIQKVMEKNRCDTEDNSEAAGQKEVERNNILVSGTMTDSREPLTSITVYETNPTVMNLEHIPPTQPQ